MEVTPYKQSLTHSCLIACFLMLLQGQKGIEFTESDEQELALKGSKRIYPFYVVGVATEIAKKYKSQIMVYVDNKYFTNVLQESFKSNTIQVIHKKITLDIIDELLSKTPLICHIDNNA